MQLTVEKLNKILAEKQGISQKKAKLIVDTLFRSMADSLEAAERIDIRGFGTFKVKAYKGYIGRNPKTGASVNVCGKKLPCFKVGKGLKERVNNGHDQ